MTTLKKYCNAGLTIVATRHSKSSRNFSFHPTSSNLQHLFKTQDTKTSESKYWAKENRVNLNPEVQSKSKDESSFYRKDWRVTKLKYFPKNPCILIRSRNEASKTELITARLASQRSLKNLTVKKQSTEPRRMSIAELFNKDTVIHPFKEKTNENEEAYSEKYKLGATFFANFLQERKKRMTKFMSKVETKNRKKPKITLNINKTISGSENALSRIVNKMKGIENPDVERRRTIRYGKWYLKPADFAKYSNIVNKIA